MRGDLAIRRLLHIRQETFIDDLRNAASNYMLTVIKNGVSNNSKTPSFIISQALLQFMPDRNDQRS